MLTVCNVSGKYTDCKPLFVQELDTVFVASGSVIQILSTVTGELVSSLCGHSSALSAISLHGTLPDHIVSSEVSGIIIVWDISKKTQVCRYDVGASVYDMVLSQYLDKSTSPLPRELVLVIGRTAKDQSAATNKSDEDMLRVVIFNTERNKTRKKIMDVRYPQNCMDVFAGPSGGDVQYIAAGHKRKLVLWGVGNDMERGSPGEHLQTVCSASDTAISAVKTVQKRDMLVTGHESGELVLWHNVSHWILSAAAAQAKSTRRASSEIAPPPSTVLHWHAHPVRALACSTDGGMIFSGGQEGVLVLWQTASMSKSFVPRLGATIKHIASCPGQAKVLVSCSDNCLRLINAASMRDEWTLHAPSLGMSSNSSKHAGLALIDEDTDPAAGRHARLAVAVNSMNGLVATNGHPGQLQMVDLSLAGVSAGGEGGWNMTSPCPVSDSLQVISYNRISRMENAVTGWDKPQRYTKLFVPSVTLFTFRSYENPTEHYMATVDVNRGEDLDPETSLKIWRWVYTSSSSSGGPKYKIVAQVDRPHSSQRVTAIVLFANGGTEAAKPGSPALASSSADGYVKIWHCVPQKGQRGGEKSAWMCAFSFRYRCCVAAGLSVSRDSTLLAVGHGTMLGLWDPNTAEMKGSVAIPHVKRATSESDQEIFQPSIRSTSFVEPRLSASKGGGCGEAYVVAVTSGSISVLDLLTMEIVWTRREKVFCLSSALDEGFVMTFPSKMGSVETSATPQRRTRSNSTCDEPQSSSSKEAWFAVSTASSSGAGGEVLMFSPKNSQPLATHSLPSPVVSMTFWSNTDPTFPFSRALVGVSKDAEMILIAPPHTSVSSTSQPSTQPMANPKAGSRKDMPRLEEFQIPVSVETARNGQEGSDSEDDMMEVVETNTSNITSEFFDSSSSAIPPVSSLYAGFMKEVLGTKRSHQSSDKEELEFGNRPTSPVEDKSQSVQAKSLPPAKRSRIDEIDYAGKIEQSLMSVFGAPTAQSTLNHTASNSDLVTDKKRKEKSTEEVVEETPVAPTTAKKSKKKSSEEVVEETPVAPTTAKKSKKKSSEEVVEETPVAPTTTRKSKKKSSEEAVEETPVAPTTAKKSKKKSTEEVVDETEGESTVATTKTPSKPVSSSTDKRKSAKKKPVQESTEEMVTTTPAKAQEKTSHKVKSAKKIATASAESDAASGTQSSTSPAVTRSRSARKTRNK